MRYKDMTPEQKKEQDDFYASKKYADYCKARAEWEKDDRVKRHRYLGELYEAHRQVEEATRAVREQVSIASMVVLREEKERLNMETKNTSLRGKKLPPGEVNYPVPGAIPTPKIDASKIALELERDCVEETFKAFNARVTQLNSTVEALRARAHMASESNNKALDRLSRVQSENASLKAEIERLTKASEHVKKFASWKKRDWRSLARLASGNSTYESLPLARRELFAKTFETPIAEHGKVFEKFMEAVRSGIRLGAVYGLDKVPGDVVRTAAQEAANSSKGYHERNSEGDD